MIETKLIPTVINLEISFAEDGNLLLNVSGDMSNWVMKRFEKCAGFRVQSKKIDSNTKHRVIIFEESQTTGTDMNSPSVISEVSQ